MTAENITSHLRSLGLKDAPFGRRTTIYPPEGSPRFDQVLWLAQGRVLEFTTALNGEKAALSITYPHSLLGVDSILDGNCQMGAEALEGCTGIYIPKNRLDELLNNPTFLRQLNEQQARQHRFAVQIDTDKRKKSLPSLASLFLNLEGYDLAYGFDQTRTVDLLNQDEIARLISVTKAQAYRYVSELVDRGLVQKINLTVTTSSGYRITNKEGLQELAESQ